MKTLVLTDAQSAQIRREGAAAYPNECCGVMLGREVGERQGERQVARRIVESLLPLTNSFETGEQFHRFRLDPLELARVEKQAGEQGKLVLGFYHSHPDHPSRPSEYDREHAWPFYSYVIVAIKKGVGDLITSWELDESTEQFETQPIAPD